MKMKKIVATSLCGFLLGGFILPAVSNNVSYAMPTKESANTRVVKFDNATFFNKATELYNSGKLSKTDYDLIFTYMTQRWGISGDTKIEFVQSGYYKGTIKIYLNNVLWSMVTGGGGVAVGLVLSALPGLQFLGIPLVAAMLGGAISTVVSAENGVIIHTTVDGHLISVRPQ